MCLPCIGSVGVMMGILTDTLNKSWVSVAQAALLNPVQSWLGEHPLAGWLLGHPLWMLALVALGLLLFAGLWSAIARLTEGFWLALVQLPWRLSHWIFAAVSGRLVRWWAKPFGAKLSGTKPSGAGLGGDRLGEIMGRLETLQTEQEGLLEEMRELLGKGKE